MAALGGQPTPADLLDDPATHLSRPADRERVVARIGEIQFTRRENARARATLLGLPLRSVMSDGRIQEIVGFDGDRPRYFTTSNVNAAISTGANLLRASPYLLSGAGVTIGLWDGGAARPTHQEFNQRVSVMDGAATMDHATHVAGTLIASGVVAAAHGMADAATIQSYDWTSDISEMTSRAATYAGEPGKIYLSNHSYGYISGWNYVNGGTPYRVWDWYGSGTSSSSIETDFGLYNSYARDDDSLAFNAPYYLIFRAGGNDRGDNPSSGQSVALSPGSTSVVSYNPANHPAGDGTYRGGFDTISCDAVAKNVMTIGSVSDAVTNYVRDVSKASVSYFSCWGPTDDGRIKPDVVANGDGLYSSLGTSDTAYGTYSGTSMATPNATGSAALLIQQYGNLFSGQAMRASTLKGLLIHTADDLGNPGPDYKHGWGLVNVQAAAALIQDHKNFPVKLRISESQLSLTTTSQAYSFEWDGVSSITATLCWTDPAATALTTSDSRSTRLVNNLDLKITAPNSSEFQPFVMPFVGTWTQASMDLPATTGINNTDNVEQVRIAAPPVAGTYQAVVSFTGPLTNNSQNYSLLISGSSAAPPPPPLPPANLVATPKNNTVNLTWNASSGATSYHVQRSPTSAGPYAVIGNTSGTSYSDTPVTNGVTYYYVISATNSGGEGANSSEVSAIPFAESSTTTVASSPVTSGDYGTAVTLTATVTGTGGPPTGMVTFKDGGTTLGTGTLNGSGLATYATSVLALGTHAITATYAGDVTFSGNISGAIGYAVGQKPVTITGVTATTKVYDGATTAVLSGGAVSGMVTGEAVTVVAGTGTFDSPNAGTQAVTTAGYALGGANAGNYVLLSQPAASGVITQRPVQLAGSRVYDGTTTAAAGIFSITNNIDGADLTLTGSTNLAGKHIGSQAVSNMTAASRVQSATGTTGRNASSTFSVTLGTTPVSGNSLVAVISTRGTSAGRVSKITQTGATWTRASQAANSSGTTTEIWYAANVSGAGNTLTITQSSLRSAAVVMEYTGVISASPVDQTGNATGSGTTPVTGTTPATTQSNELWIGGIGYISSTPTLGTFLNSFSSVASAQTTHSTTGNNAKVYALKRTQTPLGTASSGGSLSASAQWSGTIATFRTVVSGTLTPAGAAAANYTTGGTSGVVSITPRPLTVTAVSATKIYDGTTTAAGLPTLDPALAPGDTTSVLAQAYQTSAVGMGNKVILPSITINDGNGGANYAVTLVNCNTGTITQATATITLGSLAPTYDGTAKSATATTTPAGLAVILTYNGSATAPVAAGSYVVAATVNNPNYAGAATATLVIAKAAVTVTLGGLTPTYDAMSKVATVVTVPAGKAVDLTYNGSAVAPVTAGSYVVAAAVNDPNYTGSATGTLVIAKAAATVTLGSLTSTYDGMSKVPTVVTVPAGKAVNLTYNGSAVAPVMAGSYAVAATINDPNYAGAAAGTLVIAKAAATVTLDGLTATYDGTTKVATATVVPEGLTLRLTYNGLLTEPVRAGAYTVAATVDDLNYAGTATGTLVIAKAAATVTLDGLTATYDGTSKTVAATVVPEGLTLRLTYNGLLTEPVRAGAYTLAATVDDLNYSGTAAGILVIQPAGATIELVDLTQTYDGTAKPVTATTVPAGLAVDITYDGSATPPVSAGTYVLAATVNDPNGTGTAAGTLVIQPATVTIDLADLTQTYDGTPKSITATTMPIVLAVAITYDGTATPPISAGSYLLAATIIDPNFAGSATGTLVIAKAAATVTLGGLTATYDGISKTATATVVPEGLTLHLTYNDSLTEPVVTGAYAVAASVDDLNYTGAATGTLVIAKATPTVTLARHSGTESMSVYGDALDFDVSVSGAPTVTGTVDIKDAGANGTTIGTGNLSSGTCTITPALTALPAGNHANLVAVFSGDSNHESGTSTVLDLQTVSRKALTVTGVTVTPKPYDGTATAILAGTPTLNGLVGSDALTLGTTASGTFEDPGAGTGKTVNTAMTLAGESEANYSLTQPDLTGDIISRPVALTGTRTFDGTTNTAASILTVLNNIDAANLTLSGSVTLADSAVGTQPIASFGDLALGGSAAGNYTLVGASGSVTITEVVAHSYAEYMVGVPSWQTDPMQAPQNDGVVNLLKFAFNLDPLAPDCRMLTPGADASAGLPGVTHVAGHLSLEFLRRKVSGNPGITYTPQFSNDLGEWGDFTGAPTSVTDIGDGSTWERVVIDDPVGGTTRFVRVQVTQAP